MLETGNRFLVGEELVQPKAIAAFKKARSVRDGPF